jgi:glycosyltransferase involved in cell wall biosynthesis
MRVSVVINTYNRCVSLRQTLLSLRHQRYCNFEVIVVNGPSTDETESVLQPYDGVIKVVKCPQAHLPTSRNLGILAADGDIVAFLDDDAIPEPNWLIELLTGYDSSQVGAVGGIVYDHTGARLQTRYASCYRHAELKFDIEPPFDNYVRPGADPFLYLQGTNMSFSRKVLESIQGFDENILHYYDDVETCLQVIDHQFVVKALANAAVLHKYLPNHIRNHTRLMLDPYRYIRDTAYLGFKFGRVSRSDESIRRILDHKIAQMKSEAATHLAAGRFTEEQRDYFIRRLDAALSDETSKGRTLSRTGREIPPANPANFLLFSQLLSLDKRLKLCWIGASYSQDSAPRWLARAAGDGHEVHVIISDADGIYQLDMQEGVWIHRLPDPLRWCPEVESHPDEGLLKQIAACYHEVCKIQAGAPIDLVVTPLGDTLGSLCRFDDRFPTVRTPESWNADWSTTENDFRTIITTHRLTQKKTDEHKQLAMVKAKWARSLRDSLKFGSRIARAIASRLLKPARFPIDYTAEVRKLWKLSETECLQEAYQLLLGRMPKTEEIDHWLGVAEVRSTVDVIAMLALSPEARKRSIPTDWVRELVPALGHRAPGKLGLISGMRQFQNRLMRLPVFGKAMRFARKLFSRVRIV